MDRIFTHPVPQSAGRLQTRHFQKGEQGVYNGMRITHIESKHPSVNRNYRNAVMVERMDGQGQPQIFYGSYQDVQQIVTQIKDSPDQVVQRLRVTQDSPTGQHYLNKPAPPKMQEEMTPEQMEKHSTAHLLYPDQGKENRPLSVQQEEKQALKEHREKVAADSQMYPSSSEGQKAIKEQTTPVPGGQATALTDGGEA